MQDWKYVRRQSSFAEQTDNWRTVSLPHTWNVKDGQSNAQNRLDDEGQSIKTTIRAKSVDYSSQFGYYRGPAWYARIFYVPQEWTDKRVFVRFEAASQVARVYINGQMLGEHRGAFTAFCYELTSYIKYGTNNEIRVEVENTHRMDIPPLSGDFNVNGGLYRPVRLIVTDKICISPLDYASSGVYISTKSLSDNKAVVQVVTMVCNNVKSDNVVIDEKHSLSVLTTITDSSGKEIVNEAIPINIKQDTTKEILQTLDIDNPVKWQGRDNPYLYLVKVSLLKDGKSVDCIEQSFGVRTFMIHEKNGFMLNGKPYPIHGVGRHQDKENRAWAMTDSDNEIDYRIMEEMGANAIRFAHYPQSANMHDIADRDGFLVWDEIPLVNEINLDQDAKQNVRNMMVEMVKQLYNHPSVAWWGLYNEIENLYTPPSEMFLEELKDIAKKLDPDRLIVGASDHGLRPYNQIPEYTCFNNYPGWYHGNYPKEEGYEGGLSQFGDWITRRSEEVGKRIAISEYGAGGDVTQHIEGSPRKPVPAHGGKFQPEEWQTYVHEQDYRIIKNNIHLWGSFLWSMFDFASCMRNEGSRPGINTKGIVTWDRSVKKDPFYMYKANWNKEPMVYIASRRATLRKNSVTDVKVYSNCPEVVLEVNGKNLGMQEPDSIKVCVFKNVILRKGKNIIYVHSKSNSRIKDTCEWILE